MINAIVRALLVQSIAGGCLIIIMLAMRKLCTKRISARLTYALWLVVAIRLLIPLELPGIDLGGREHAAAPIIREVVLRATNAEREPVAAPTAHTAPAVSQSAANAGIAHDKPAIQRSPSGYGAARAPWQVYAFSVWASGALLATVYMALTNLIYAKKLSRRARRVCAPGALPVYAAQVESPCLAGLFSPRIYINPEAEANDILPYAVAHETAHARRMDNLWLLVRNIILAIYWFHPLVWVAAITSTRDCESACDERVTRGLSRSEAADYARALIRLSAAKNMRFALASDMSSAKGVIKTRVTRILGNHPVQRWACCLCTLILLAVSVLSCATGEVSVESVTLPEAFSAPPSYSVAGDNVALLVNGKLYASAGSQWTLIGEYPDAVSVASGARGVYLCVSASAGDVISRIRADGTPAESFNLPDSMRVKHMVWAGEGIALIAEAETGYINDFTPRVGAPYLMDLNDGTLRQITKSLALDLCADEMGNVYVLAENDDIYEWSVMRYSRPGGEAEEVCRVIPYSVMSMAASDSGLYICNGAGSIEYIRFDDGQSEIIADAALSDTGSYQIARYGGGCIYAFAYGGSGEWKFHKIEIAALDDDKEYTLTIVNFADVSYGKRARYMARWFSERYPNVKLSYITVDNDKLATRLMAGDTQIDMVYGHAGLMDQYALSGAFLPLNDMDGLHSAMEASGFLDYRPLMTYGGKLYGVADDISLFAFHLNVPLLDSLGLTWPEAPYSWTELADWAIPALSGTEYRLFDDFMCNPMTQYVDMAYQLNGEVILDTPEFRRSLDAYKRLYKAGLVAYERARNSADLLADIDELYMGAYAPLPTLEGIKANTAYAHGFYVSSATENLDLVMAYLTEYVSADCQNNGEYGCPYFMLIEETDGYSREFMEIDMRTGAFDYREETDHLRIESYDGIVLRNRDYQLLHALEDQGALAAYLEDEISIDEYIYIVQPRLDMIQYE